jgi:hypothetical protein
VIFPALEMIKPKHADEQRVFDNQVVCWVEGLSFGLAPNYSGHDHPQNNQKVNSCGYGDDQGRRFHPFLLTIFQISKDRLPNTLP